ncbi:MAG: hypothetical protein FD170_555 [Bacteroidetes bacterium]|nr:MAG: hypothetical protein FD170_555 [Bacteroidota bacterium]
MKRMLLITGLILAIAMPNVLKAQSKADKAVGYYLTYDDETGKEKSQIRIYKAANGKYVGEIVWLKDPKESNGKDKLDNKNPDNKLKTRKIMGLQILKDFTYDASLDEWSGGTIYNPSSGKTYNSYMKLEGNKMQVRGYIGKAWMGLGKTATWTREEKQRK